jgi:hypothetical protein
MIKKSKLFGLAAIVTTILFIAVSVGMTSCPGPEGPMGPEGPKGPSGSSGQDGSDGSSGQDGQDGSDGRPAIPVVPCTVTYDTGEGTKIKPQELMKGDKVNRPENAFRPFTLEQMYAEGAGLYRAGVSNGWILLGWKMEDGSYYDFDKAVTSDLHLTADWAMPGKIDTGGIGAVPANTNFFDKALDYVIKEPASYYLVIDEDYTAQTEKIATATGISLIIVGLDSERTITSGTGNGRLFQINNGAQLHLESNIILKGKVTNSTSNLITITNGSLTMNDGSKITGYTTASSGSGIGMIYLGSSTAHFVMNGGEISGNQCTNINGGNAIISISSSGSSFTMNGGTIKENTVAAGGCINIFNSANFIMTGGTITGNTNTNTGAHSGGVYIQNTTTSTGLRMSGGSITGNDGVMGDVYKAAVSSNSSAINFYAGDAVIGVLTTVHHTGATTASNAAQIRISGKWTGSVQTLNLYYNNAAFNTTLYNNFANKFLVAALPPYVLTGADIDNFKQVNFMRADFQTQSIGNTSYVFVKSGADIGKIN